MLKLASILITCTVVFYGVADSCTITCPALWENFDGSCYRLFRRSLTFNDAEQACQSHKVVVCGGDELTKGHLASVHSPREQGFLEDLVTGSLTGTFTCDTKVYIGRQVGDSIEDQTWTDGSPNDYSDWKIGHPAHFPNSRGTITAGACIDTGGEWDDIHPESRNYYICKLPCVEYRVYYAPGKDEEQKPE
ncbi:Echinoidin [Holothuria leucospilota]|uniref:Echinoidin n=1 Tax=Holothuria leucospilota TaxID=206669 RepID=A0A9Q1BXE4_HOLLE|nr:Echinoidin [Holothuria leucospilota]